MALSYVQKISDPGTFGTSKVNTFGSALGANPNILSFLATFGANAAGSASITDSVNGAHTSRVTTSGSKGSLWTLLGSASGTPAVTCSPNAGDWFGSGAVEFSGTSVTPDGTATNSDTTGTTQTAGSVTTTADCIVFGLIAYYSSTVPTVGSGWTEIASSTDLGFEPYSLIYKTGAAGSYNPTWTTSGPITYEACTIAFKESGGGGGGGSTLGQLLVLGVG